MAKTTLKNVKQFYLTGKKFQYVRIRHPLLRYTHLRPLQHRRSVILPPDLWSGSMAPRDTIVIGASAGGVQALYKLVSALPPNLPAAVFIVLHIPSNAPSLLPEILARDSHLIVAHAIDGERIKRGKVYVAPPDRHLLIEDSHVRLIHGPKENRHRPSIDTLFRSAARWAGSRVIGTVLTGAPMIRELLLSKEQGDIAEPVLETGND
jgi:chemotaxis response regulator CheB